MNRVETPQTRCRAGIARCDITPPVGIYHRMWGAALHDRATGVHRPLTATALWLEAREAGSAHVVVGIDQCILDAADLNHIRSAVEQATGVCAADVHVSLSHTHGSGLMSRQRSELPGGDLIGPYLDEMIAKVSQLACEAKSRAGDATVSYGVGRCALAANRDLFDAERGLAVCGFNPAGRADDTVLVGRISADDGRLLATLVNYACHPTTLAWENTLISPDWVGAMRETVEAAVGGVCLFLQGASGDLGPREGFVGDVAVADRNGRQLGYAVLAALEALPSAGTEYAYAGPVVSGAVIGTWMHQPLSTSALEASSLWRWTSLVVELPYRHDLSTLEETTQSRDRWLREEEDARRSGDALRVRDCRAHVEQMTRKIGRLAALKPGSVFPLTVTIGQLGGAIWVFVPGELYQIFQTTLRARLAPRPVFVVTLTNDWQPGYIPPADVYGYGIYQEIVAAVAPGGLETLIEAIVRAGRALIGDPVR